MRVAVVGDPHACFEEFKELYEHLQWFSLDEVWVCGDLCDRGPDIASLVDFCIEKNIKSVLGNHDDSIVNHWDRVARGGSLPRDGDKRRTLAQLKPHHVEYLRSLPLLHVIDELNLVLAHGGLWPKLPLYQQPLNIIRCGMIHPEHPGKTRWFGLEASMQGATEDESRAAGWERFYRVYDHSQTLIYGHHVWAQPFIHQNEGAGATIGVDTGICFGGSLTACIYDNIKPPFFVSVKAKKVWHPLTRRSWWEV